YRVFFFFQAEDGIRDRNVTGVQTCALPISRFAASLLTLPRRLEAVMRRPLGTARKAHPLRGMCEKGRATRGAHALLSTLRRFARCVITRRITRWLKSWAGLVVTSVHSH